jgi:hypothetical protein
MASGALLTFDADALGSEVDDPALVLSAVYEVPASRGVLRLADEGRADALRYLELAARLRTPALVQVRTRHIRDTRS